MVAPKKKDMCTCDTVNNSSRRKEKKPTAHAPGPPSLVVVLDTLPLLTARPCQCRPWGLIACSSGPPPSNTGPGTASPNLARRSAPAWPTRGLCIPTRCTHPHSLWLFAAPSAKFLIKSTRQWPPFPVTLPCRRFLFAAQCHTRDSPSSGPNFRPPLSKCPVTSASGTRFQPPRRDDPCGHPILASWLVTWPPLTNDASFLNSYPHRSTHHAAILGRHNGKW